MVQAVDNLTTADVEILAGDLNDLIDLARSEVVQSHTVRGAGSHQTLKPIKSDHPVLVPTQTTYQASSAVYDSATTDALSRLDSRNTRLAVLLTRSGVGWIFNARPIDQPASSAPRQFNVSDIVRTNIMWDNDDRCLSVRDIIAIPSDGSYDVRYGGTQAVYYVLDTAGTVNDVAVSVGINTLAASQPASGSVAVVGARGWICVVEEVSSP